MINTIKKYLLILFGAFIIILFGILAATFSAKLRFEDIRGKISTLNLGLATSVDVDDFVKLTGDPSDIQKEEYELLRNQLVSTGKIYKETGIYGMYMFSLKNDELISYVDSLSANDPNHRKPGDKISNFSERVSAAAKRVWTVRKTESVGPYSSKGNVFESVFSPIIDPKSHKILGVFGIDIDFNLAFQKEINREYLSWSMYTIIAVFFYLLLIFYVHRIKQNKIEVETYNEKLQEIMSSLTNVVYIFNKNLEIVNVFRQKHEEDSREQEEDLKRITYTMGSNKETVVGLLKNASETKKKQFFKYHDGGSWYRVTITFLPDGNYSWTEEDFTAELDFENKIMSKNEELEKLNKALVGRELKMIELKNKIAFLEKK